MSNHTIHPNDCGNCKHWHPWEKEEQKYYPLLLGNCDKISRGEKFSYTLEEGGKEYEAEYDGYSFEDECYDEYFNCFEEAEE